MLVTPYGYPAEDPITRLALNAAGDARIAENMPIPDKCLRFAHLYVQAGVLGSLSEETYSRSMAIRSRENTGITYLEAGCPAGALLVLSMALQDYDRDERAKNETAHKQM